MSKKLQGIIKGIKDLKKGAKKKVREDLVSKERRRKKMEAEKPLSARRDMANKSRPETAKKRRERIRKKRIGTSGLTVGTEEAIAKGIIGATGITSPIMGIAGAALTSPAIGGKATIQALGAAPREGKALGGSSRLAIPIGGRVSAGMQNEQ